MKDAAKVGILIENHRTSLPKNALPPQHPSPALRPTGGTLHGTHIQTAYSLPSA